MWVTGPGPYRKAVHDTLEETGCRIDSSNKCHIMMDMPKYCPAKSLAELIGQARMFEGVNMGYSTWDSDGTRGNFGVQSDDQGVFLYIAIPGSNFAGVTLLIVPVSFYLGLNDWFDYDDRRVAMVSVNKSLCLHSA